MPKLFESAEAHEIVDITATIAKNILNDPRANEKQKEVAQMILDKRRRKVSDNTGKG